MQLNNIMQVSVSHIWVYTYFIMIQDLYRIDTHIVETYINTYPHVDKEQTFSYFIVVDHQLSTTTKSILKKSASKPLPVALL